MKQLSAIAPPAIFITPILHRNTHECKFGVRTVSSFVEFFSGVIHERISDFFAKCGLGHQASPRRRQSHASLAIPVFLNYFVKNFLYNAYINVITSATIVEQTISINIL